ncbi:betaine-aldehyde dehydrogenase [Nosocomiicoccus sp. HMSC067E10]|uniref:aldehyde dehydrogenase family protein n=1 Tax=Nosocomiicoccus sp. HMSC067E10 TaxID=1739271 RepID=UPI0008A4069C|nr:aldehyde dehydrogenase family protein [Nosocomiicoccus sp. HMSC067E10]OFL46257.1 betaine-aldehyde dehydrogenase [Nosocomiicoccus sp. HMSC067E10]
MKYDKIYIDGEWVKPSTSDLIEVENPATEEIFTTVAKANSEDVDKAVEAAARAFKSFNETSYEERQKYVEEILNGIKERQEDFEKVIRQELGSSYNYTKAAQVEQAIKEMTLALENADKVKFTEHHEGFDLVREGVGVVAAVTPWNFPLNQIQRKLTCLLLAGATVVLKPSTKTPVAAFLLAEVIDKTSLPKGVFNIVPGSGSEVGDALTGHEKVDMISFTGSTKVGRGIYEQAKSNIKNIHLELGGKSPNILLPKGDAKRAVKQSMDAIINNAGQACSALTRLIVPESRLEEVEAYVKQYIEENVRVGNPEDENNTIGPVVSKEAQDRVYNYIESGKKEATLLIGGGRVESEDKGYYVEPTVFTKVDNNSKIAQEEIFGPVLSIITYNDVDEAVEIANDTTYGLYGAVFGENDEEAYDVAKKLRTGSIIINGAARNPAAPFGGYKQSGIGKEIGWIGIEEYTETKVLFKE